MEETFSYSRMDSFCQCGFKYKLKYVDGHNVFCQSIATEFGTAIHEIEEKIANCIKNGVEIPYTELKNTFIIKNTELEAKYPADYTSLDKSDRTYRDKAFYYLDTGIYRLEKYLAEHPTYEVVAAEKEFNLPYKDSYSFKGFIDRIFRDTVTGKYIIQDIKSYAIPVESKKLATPLQFVVYTYAVEKLFNCTAQDIICQYDLPLCDLIQDAGTAGYMIRGLTKIDEIFNSIAQESYSPNATPLCHWCEFCSTNQNAPVETKYLCPYFSHWTRENKDFSKENCWQGLDNHQIILEAYHKKYSIKN